MVLVQDAAGPLQPNEYINPKYQRQRLENRIALPLNHGKLCTASSWLLNSSRIAAQFRPCQQSLFQI